MVEKWLRIFASEELLFPSAMNYYNGFLTHVALYARAKCYLCYKQIQPKEKSWVN